MSERGGVVRAQPPQLRNTAAFRRKISRNTCTRLDFCYIANDLQLVNPMNRSWRPRWHAVVAGFSLALWLFMAAAEACPTLHAWLHGGAVPDQDDCAVVAVAHGKVETIVADIPVVVPVTTLEIIFLPEFSAPHTASVILPDGRGPPVFCTVS